MIEHMALEFSIMPIFNLDLKLIALRLKFCQLIDFLIRLKLLLSPSR